MTDSTLRLQSFTDPIDDADPDPHFKREVAFYSAVDPMPTLESMSTHMQIPVGALARYILVKWATSGNEGIMEIGPRVIRQMVDIVEEAERHASSEARLQAYGKLSDVISLLNSSL